MTAKGRRFFKLTNTIKHYDWGSPRRLPELLGVENPEGRPWAELWMGVHPEGPSRAGSRPLPELIGEDPCRALGAETVKSFGGLPFLFKLLSAERPLSIQAHPNQIQAREGWDRENARGLSPGDPARNYRDGNHKPEILAAIDPFTALSGFRNPEEIIRLLNFFSSPANSTLRGALGELGKGLTGGNGALRGFLTGLFALPPEARGALSEGARENQDRLGELFPEYGREWELCAVFAAAYPGDPGVLAPLYLNVLSLEPGEAIFLPAGVLHAYVKGFGAELMANSDNVLRGGLSSKRIDREELFRILDFSPFKPEILRPPLPFPPWFRYPSECREFSLARLQGRGDERIFPDPGPAILAVTAGKAELVAGEERLPLGTGESAFIARGDGGEIRIRGDYRLYAAGINPASAKTR